MAMKPVLVLQHLCDDGPAYLQTWLQREGVAFELRNTAAGEGFPADLAGHRAVAILGGSISANDPLPSLRQAERLVRAAVAQGVPLLGHCLGGQLMARALGGTVEPAPVPEVGWLPMTLADAPAARAWFGDAPVVEVFQWHFEAFGLPDGAEPLAASPACPRQAFAIGPHLAMQFHIEQDVPKLRAWVAAADAHYRAALVAHPGTVQSPRAMLDDADRRCRLQQRLADRVYARWLAAAG